MHEICRPHLHRPRPGDQKFQRIGPGGNPPQANHRHAHGTRNLPDHPQRQRLDGGAGKAPGGLSQTRAARLQIDRHAGPGISHRQRIGTRLSGSAGKRRDVGDVGRELHHQRPPDRRAPGGAHHLAGEVRVNAELHAALFHVGAGDVQLVGGQALGLLQLADDLHVLLHRVAEDVGDDGGVILPQSGELFGDEAAHADVLQADRVQHPGRGLAQARGRRSLDGLRRQPFDDDAPQPVQVHQGGELYSITKGAGGYQDRILQAKAGQPRRWRGQLNAEVHLHALLGIPLCGGVVPQRARQHAAGGERRRSDAKRSRQRRCQVRG